MERQFQKLNWLTLRELIPEKIDTVLLSIGTVEAHGSACVGTDNLVPENIAEGIADRLDALIAPTIPYGITKSLLRYTGAMTVGVESFARYVREVLDSLVNTGFRNIIVLNGHGGNNSTLKDIAFEFHADKKANIAIIHWWELCAKVTEKHFGHVGGHSGTDETAMVQAIDASLVDESQHDPNLAYLFRPGADVYPVPGTILLYKEGEGQPEFDIDQAKRYRKKVITEVGDFAEMVVKRWRELGL